MPTSETTLNFDTVESIRKTTENMQLAENIRARDRALIDTLANGERPYTPDEVEKYQIKYNINWGELNKQLRDANRQVNGALLYKPTLFTATSNDGEVEKRDEYGQNFTIKTNRKLLKKDMGRSFRYALKSRNASVCLHGIGALYWPNDYCVLPKFVPLENLLIPTDTLCDFSNLSYFDVKTELTPYELYERTHGEKVDEHWEIDQVNKILEGLKDVVGVNPNNYNWVEYPEKMQEIFKQNRCFLNSDAVAKVKLDYFFYQSEDDESWYLKIFMREGIGEADADEFVYQSDQPFADSINKILHVQYGDNSIVAPLKYHSVRGLGQSLYSPAEALNRFRSGLFQHGEEQLRMYFYANGTTDKARQNVIELMQYGIIEDGIKIVPEDERHQVDANLIDSIMSQCRQNLSENSNSFVQDINDGTKKEMTLGEAQIRQQSVNIAVSSLLTMMYIEETPLYEEIVRRLLAENSGNKEVEAFQKDLVSSGIPKDLLKTDNWNIEPDKVLGGGDRSLALQEAGALFQARQSFDPKSQRIIDRQFVSTITNDPAKGMMLVPDVKDDASSGAKAASSVFGSLMCGAPVPLIQGIEQTDYITQMLQSLSAVIEQVKSTDNTGTLPQVIGMANVAEDIQKHIDILSADPNQSQMVKMMGDAVGKLQNEIKAFGQRISEKNKAGQPNKVSESLSYKDAPDDIKRQIEMQAGLQPSTMAVPDPKTAKTIQSLQNNQAKFNQKIQHSQIAFEIQQIQSLTAHQNELSIEKQKSNQELIHNHAAKLQELYLASQQQDQVPE